MTCMDCVANTVGYYIGSTLEKFGDGMALVAPSIVLGSQLVGTATSATAVVSGIGELTGLSNYQRTEKYLMGALVSVIVMWGGVGINKTATKVQALGLCLQDQNRSVFTGC